MKSCVRKHWKIPNDISKAVPLKVMAKELNYTPQHLKDTALRGKTIGNVRCFKIKRYWYCIRE